MSQHEISQVLIVDDEPEIRALLRAGLEAEGFGVVEAASGAEAEAHLDRQPIALMTLDLKLGGEDGLKLARDFRAKRNTPIIMITGKGDPIDRVVGLELGADDYISKPFLMREVVARVRAVLRRYVGGAEEADTGATERPDGTRFAFDGWSIDVKRREVRDPKGANVELTTAEFNLLIIFVQRPGRVLSRDELMDLLKGHDWTPMDRSIDGLVARLRKKIEPESERPQLVKTVRGVGYAFAGSVKRV
ncbi:response regulator [Hyphomicrobium sp. LHD-15]|uniref:response regulator n=1 Tax=Hyphomicrobium sp. LHD-15 TaxID=3072142 RepID=UPI00280F84E9|nr:response regulator [Hyphomicrobium sp. LHD-15]MDQ8700678.1 response regulator [Hyphomicrobium sp. LHD-15]